jgi:site-specific DNA-methyltransferase (adenine-specific)
MQYPEDFINKVIHGDCLQILKDIPDNSVDMVFADLPYNVTACSWDVEIPLTPLWEQLERITKNNCAIVFTATQPFASFLVLSNLKLFKYDWVWDKVRPNGFLIAKYRPMMRHENILVFSKGKLKWNPIKEKRDKPIKGKVYTKTKLFHAPSHYSDQEHKLYEDKHPQSILTFYKQEGGKFGHPTQKPVTLLEYLIKTYTNENDVVLDPVAGSGTTGIAARNLNRKYILIEKDEKYVNLIKFNLIVTEQAP